MAARSKAKADQEEANGSGNKWQQLLDELSTGGGPFFFPKAGKIRFRIVPEDGDDMFYREVDSTYQGRTKSKYIVRGVVLNSSQGELSEQYQNRIVPIVLPKSALKQIIELLAEDYELFDWTEGYGVTLQKSGEGFGTSYSIIASRAPIPLDPEEIEEPEETLDDWAEQFAHRQSSHNTSSGNEGGSGEETGW